MRAVDLESADLMELPQDRGCTAEDALYYKDARSMRAACGNA